jgi:hypothetical protein
MTYAGSMSLFDVEDLDVMPKVRDMTVGRATMTDVDEFCRRYHYTATGGNRTWRYALWHGPTVLGIVAYNLPTREACEAVFGPDHYDKVWHMGRLALAETAPRNSESRLIGGSLQLIQRDHPDVWGVLTYAATDQGHIGYVYQATNALYTGATTPEAFYLDQKGRRRSSYLGGHRVTLDRAASLSWEPQKGQPKHRYVYILGDRRQRRNRLSLLRLPTLPYPKPTERD